MEILREFKEHGYFTSRLYHLLTKKKLVDAPEDIIPSVYEKEMTMTCADRLKALNNIEIDNIMTTGGQKADKPILEFTPRILVFQNYKPSQRIVAKLTVKNIAKAPTYMNMVFKESSYFSIKPITEVVQSRLAPGISVTFAITFIPRNEREDYTHRVTFYTDIDQYVIALIGIGSRPIINFPDEIVIPDTPLKVENSVHVSLKNIGNVTTQFALNTRCPFAVHPKSFYLLPDSVLNVKVSLKTMYLGQAHGVIQAMFETGENFRIDVKGNTNIVSIELEKATVRFLDTYNTMCCQQSYKINNKSDHIITYTCMKNESVYHDFQDKIKLATKLYDVKETEAMKYTKLVRYDVVSSSEHERVYTRIFYDEVQELVVDQSLHFNNTHFCIDPIKGYLWPKQTTELTISFAPKEIGEFQFFVYLDIDGIKERVPLKLVGTSLPPCIRLNCETLDMDSIYINKNYHYEIVAMNRGHINGLIEYKERPSLFGSLIRCSPAMLCLQPGEKQTFTITLCNSNQGPYFEEIHFVIRDTKVLLKLYLKGEVVYPSLMFSESCLDFMNVSVGVPKTLTLEVINESVANVKGTFKISSDGPEINAMTLEDVDVHCADINVKMPSPPWPREFRIEPEQVEIATDSRICIKVTLIANMVRANQTQLELELENSDSPPIVLPVVYNAMVPEIRPNPPINLRACFTDYTYREEVVLKANDYRGFFAFEEPEDKTTLSVTVAKRSGIIEPNSTIVIPISISTETIGIQEYSLRMSLFGLPKPIEVCYINACGVKPIVTCTPLSLQWGQLKLLNSSNKTLTLCNDSPVRVKFKTSTLYKDERWTISPAEGFIQPESETVIVITVYLIDAANYFNKAVIHLEKVKDILVPLSVTGIGTSILVGELGDTVCLGAHFTKILLDSKVTIKNCGSRAHTMEWIDNYKSTKPSTTPASVPLLKLGLSSFKLAAGEEIEMSITGMSPKACIICDTWYLVGGVEGNNKKELLLKCSITAEFLDPKIELSTTQIQLQYDNGPYDEYYKLTDIFTLKNDSKLPLDVEISIKPPFAMIEKQDTYKISKEEVDLCGCLTYKETDLNVEKMNKEFDHQQSKALIDCLTLKPIEPLHEGSLLLFQDIHKIKTVFNLTHSIEEHLGDQETMRIQILMDVTKHTTLKSKIYSDVLKIKFQGNKNKDSVKVVGKINFPNIFVVTPKVDFQCILNQTVACKTFKIQNPTPLLDCFKFNWKKCYIETLKMPEVIKPDLDIHSKIESAQSSRRSSTIPACPTPSRLLSVFEENLLEQSHDSKGHLSSGLSPEFKSRVSISRSIEIDEETMKTKILQRIIPMLPPERDTGFPWAHKFPKMEKYKCDINDIFQIIPHRGLLRPGDMQYVNVMFQPFRNVNIQAVLDCEVLGGQSESIIITGQSSDLMYTLNTQKLNFKIRSFHESATETIKLNNIAYLPFKYTTYLNEPKFENELYATIRNVDPPEMVLEPKQQAEINVNLKPGVVGYFNRIFILEIGHLPHLTIEVLGWGVIPQVYLSCPRPEIEKLHVEIGYKAISDLTLEYLEAVGEIFEVLPSERCNSPLKERYSEDPLFRSGWYICSPEDVPSTMDIELAIERLLVINQIKHRPDMIAPSHSNKTRSGSIPNSVTFTSVIDFGVVITGSKIHYLVDVINYGPIPTKLILKPAHHVWLNFKVCGKLMPGETGKLEVTFTPNAEYFRELEQNMETRVDIEVPHGVLIPVKLKALVGVPYLKSNLSKVDLGSVKCGDKLMCFVPLKNVGKPVCIWYVTLRQKSSGPSPVSVLENSGKYEAGEGGWLTLSFKPTMEMLYEGMLIFRFHMNPTRLIIPIVGYGILPHVHVIGPNIDFPPTLPWADATEMYFGLTNPCKFPIELIIAHSDPKWQEEEDMFNLLSKYYNKLDEMLVPAIEPGSGLPPEIPNFYKRFQNTVKREKELELAAASSKPSSPALKKHTGKSPKGDQKSTKDPTTLATTARKARTEMEIIADSINILKNLGVNPLAECVERIKQNSLEAKSPKTHGFILLVHGSPTEVVPCLELAYKVGKELHLPTVSIDNCIIEALCVCKSLAQRILVKAIDEQYRFIKQLNSVSRDTTDAGETNIQDEEDSNNCDDEFCRILCRLEYLAAHKINVPLTPKSKAEKKQISTMSKIEMPVAAATAMPPPNLPYMFKIEYLQDLLTEFFTLDKFSSGFIVDSLTSFIINMPAMVLTTVIKSKPEIQNIHLVLCQADFSKWLLAFEETQNANTSEHSLRKEYTENEIKGIISSFEEMDADEYENADPEEKAAYIKYGLEARRQKHGIKAGRAGDKEKEKEKKESHVNIPATVPSESKKKGPTKGKGFHCVEVTMMNDKCIEHAKTLDLLMSIANNWNTKGDVGSPIPIPGQASVATTPKKPNKKSEGQSRTALQDTDNISEERGFPLTIISRPCLEYKTALIKMLKKSPIVQAALKKEEKIDVLSCNMRREIYTVLLPKIMPIINHEEALAWLYLDEEPLKKCECNQITDLNLIDDSTQGNVLNILSKWHCSCGQKYLSSTTSTSKIPYTSKGRKLERTPEEDDKFPYPKALHSTNTISEISSRIVLQPGDLLRCKYKFTPRAEGNYNVKRFVEVMGWPDSRVDINVIGICDIPRLDSRPKKMFQHFVRRTVDDEVYKKTFLEDMKLFEFGPIFVGQSRMYEEDDTINLRNCSLLLCEVNIEFEEVTNVFQLDTNSIRLEPGCKSKIKVSAAPTTVGVHTSQLLFCIKDNPKIIKVTIACTGVKPQIEIMPLSKRIDYGKVLLYRREDDRFIVKNDSILAVMWKIRDIEDFFQNFIISNTSGIVQSNENQVVPIAFIACQVGVINNQVLTIDIYDELGRGTPMVTDTLFLSAECYDVRVDCSYQNPLETFLNFGNVRVNSTVMQEMYLVNRGKYNVFFKLKKVKNFPNPALLKTFRATPESGEVFATLNKITTVQFECVPAVNVNLVNVPAYTCSLLDPSKNLVVVAKFPVCITVTAFYNTFTLFPLGEMNFHITNVGSAVTREVTLNNTSKCPVTYDIIVPDKYRLPVEAEILQPTKAKDNKIKFPGIKCGNFFIMNGDNLLAPGASRTIQIEFQATEARLFEETIHFVVSDTCPAEAGGVPFKLVGMGAKPTLDFWNMDITFREHVIVKSLSVYKHPEIIPHCVFAEDSVTMYFLSVTINTSFKASLDLYNNGLVNSPLSVKLIYQSNTNDRIFSCDRQELVIEPMMHKTLTIKFSPKELLEYRAVMELRLKSVGDEDQYFRLCLIGVGTIPRIKLVSPAVREYRLADLHFPMTSLGSKSIKSIVIKNISQLKTSATLTVLQSPNERKPIFTLSVPPEYEKQVVFKEKRKYQHQTKLKIALNNDETSKINIIFNPLNKGRKNCDVRITIKDNPYEFFTIFCKAEAFTEDVMLLGLEMLSMETDMVLFRADATERPMSQATGDKKKSKSAPTQDKKKKEQKSKSKTKSATSIKPDVETSELKYVLDFGGCELSTMHKRSVTMVNKSDKLYKFTWETMSDIIVIKPTMGYISPGEEKDLEVVFFSPQPIVIRKELLNCNLAVVDNDALVLNNQGATWDSRQTVTMFENNHELGVQERLETVVHGPILNIDDHMGTITINIYYSGTTEYTKYTTNLPEEITLDDTFIYEETSFKFKVTNIGTVPMRIMWHFYVDEEYPRRTDKPHEIIHARTTTPVGPSEGSIRESAVADAGSPDSEAHNEYVAPETKKDESKVTLFSKSESRLSVDTWFEVDLPLKIEPAMGCLKSKETKEFKVTFSPQDAFNFKFRLKSTIDKLDPYDQNKSCVISARALVPVVHLDLEESDYLTSGRSKKNKTAAPQHIKCLEFNVVGVGCYKKTVNIVNPTSEGYEFYIDTIREATPDDIPMLCNPIKGYVDAGTSQEITFSFSPTHHGTYESQWKILICSHSLAIILMVVGHAREPDVELLPTILIIDNTLVGYSSQREFILKNNEPDTTVIFKYNGNSLINQSGKTVVAVSPEKGTIKPRSQQIITVTYSPLRDGPVSFKIFYSVTHREHDLALIVNSLSYSITPVVTYYLYGNEHLLDATAKTHIHLDQTAMSYERKIRFKLRNNGSITFRYDWLYSCTSKVKKYLQVWLEPKSGFIGPGCENDCTLHLIVKDAKDCTGVKPFPVDLEIAKGIKYNILLHANIEQPLYHFSSTYYDFGMCIINAPDKTYKKNFVFYNEDHIPVRLTVNTTSSPDLLIDFIQAVVEPRKHANIPIYFRPKAVKDYVFRLQFWVNTLCEENIVIRGQGVPVLIDIYEPCEKSFYLGPVDVGKKVTQYLSVRNQSKVALDVQFLFTDAFPAHTYEQPESACSSICLIPDNHAPTQNRKTRDSRVTELFNYHMKKTKAQNDADCATALASLKVIPTRAVIQPYRKETLKIIYKPISLVKTLISIVMSTKVFDLIKPLAILSGYATGHNLRFNQSSLQFGCVRKYGMKTMNVLLMNDGDYPAKFYFQPLTNDEFTITPMSGDIALKSQCLIDIVFRPQRFNSFIKVWVKCSFDNHKPLELVMYAACAEDSLPQLMSLQFECPVRETKTESIRITNPSDVSWNVSSAVSLPFETLKEFIVKKGTTFEIPITFRPLTMGHHEGTASFSPLGESALMVQLMGIASKPLPAGTINFTVDAKVPKTLELAVHNVTEKPEVYLVSTELDKVVPHNFTGYYEVKFAETIKVWGEATGTCYWNYVCYEPCEMVCKVFFENKETQEYQYYIISVNVKANKVVKTITLVCRARERVQEDIVIANPLDVPSDYYVRCDRLKVDEVIQIERNSEKRCTISFFPIVVGDFQDNLFVTNNVVGTSSYLVIARCLPAEPKQLECTTTLGSCIPLRLRVRNHAETKATFTTSATHPSITLEKEYTLDAEDRGKFVVWFEPIELGIQKCTVTFYSPVAGEFVFKIKGTATMPEPEGPYQIKRGSFASIRFKNIFLEPQVFRIFVDTQEFMVQQQFEEILPKKEVRIKVFWDNSPEDSSTNVRELVGIYTRERKKDEMPTGCLIVEPQDPTEPNVQWTYFLQGV